MWQAAYSFRMLCATVACGVGSGSAASLGRVAEKTLAVLKALLGADAMGGAFFALGRPPIHF